MAAQVKVTQALVLVSFLSSVGAQEAGASNEWQRRVDSRLEVLFDADLEEASIPEAAVELARLGPKAGARMIEEWIERAEAHAASSSSLAVDPLFFEARVRAALQELGVGAEPALRVLLREAQQPRWETCRFALSLLAGFGPFHASLRAELGEIAEPDCETAQAIVPRHLMDLDVRRVHNQMSSAWFFLRERLTVDPHSDVEVLLDWLASGNKYQVEFSAQLLGRHGIAAIDAMDALHELAQDYPGCRAEEVCVAMRVFPVHGRGTYMRSEELQRAVGDALIAIAPDDPRALPAHMHRLSRGSVEQQLASVRALRELGPQAASAVDSLVWYARRGDDRRLLEVLRALEAIGPDAQAAVPMLEGLGQGPVEWSEELLQAAQRALVAIRGG